MRHTPENGDSRDDNIPEADDLSARNDLPEVPEFTPINEYDSQVTRTVVPARELPLHAEHTDEEDQDVDDEDEIQDEDSKSWPNSRKSTSSAPSLLHMAGSTFISLMMVLVLLAAARWMVPSLVESLRYSWHSGQLRAEYEQSGQRLRSVSLDSLADVSQLVSQRMAASVVHVNLLRDVNSNNPLLRYEGQGSGFIIDQSGYVLTNHHVIADTGRIEVTLSDGRQLPAEIVGFDSKTDLAVLKVKAVGLMPVEWGDSDSVVVGTPVWAVGSPYGLHQTVTFGIISGMHRLDLRGTRYHESNYGKEAHYGDLMQSDVAVNPGNSGGPLVNAMGQVVGVNAAILGESYRGISFSIPSKVAKRVAESLIQSGEVVRGWLGVRMEELNFDNRYNEDGSINPGVRIVGFAEPSPAQDAGLMVGDIIVQFQSKPVTSQPMLMNLIGQCDAGVNASITVKRDDDLIDFMVTLGKRNIKL